MLCQGERWGVVNPVWYLSTLNGSQRLCINELGQHCVTHELKQQGGAGDGGGVMDVMEMNQHMSLLRVTLSDLMRERFLFETA